MFNRFFYDGPLAPGPLELEGAEAHHLAAVRRLGPGERISLFNGTGSEWSAAIVRIAKRQVSLLVDERADPPRELGIRLHVAAAMPKGERGDFLVEKLTEIGVTDFTPLITERSVVKPGASKPDKLRRAVIEASKQCGRNTLMQIHMPKAWHELCQLTSGCRFLAHPDGARVPGRIVSGDVTVAIGPEGGFTPGEVQTAAAAGWEMLGLGPTILRVETAALAAAILLAAHRV